MTLSDEQIERYSRQILVPEIGARGQQRIIAARVLIVGSDPIAMEVAAYLEAAGVGRVSFEQAGDHAYDLVIVLEDAARLRIADTPTLCASDIAIPPIGSHASQDVHFEQVTQSLHAAQIALQALRRILGFPTAKN